MASSAMSMCTENCTNAGMLYEFASDEMWAQWNAVADYFEYQPWIFSLIGSAMVGLSGILPLLVIPIEDGANLKNGAGAGTLKILLSFAVGGLLGDVFLHLLPEAWANKALNLAHADGSRPMACGLWVLAGFLVFIVAEKMFIGEGENDEDENQDEDNVEQDEKNFELEYVPKDEKHEYLNNNDDNELENNNCLTLKNDERKNNEFFELEYSNDVEEIRSTKGLKSRLKNGYAINRIGNDSRDRINEEFIKNTSRNGNVDSLSTDSRTKRHDDELSRKNCGTNGYTKVKSNFVNEKMRWNVGSSLDADDSRKSNVEFSVSSPKPKAKHITGYLNLMANCIDNFTHGLAVGGSFLVSFRLGVLTTFAILIHEIPHEVGDFAILLKSGFSRWDAARAQILTASGGIFGALIAVVCSGSGVESRTSWILPFTAGGFLHIGMVSILPELLKESNPKESFKQLGALLSGITVMAILTMVCD